jgi:hypothetical protein
MYLPFSCSLKVQAAGTAPCREAARHCASPLHDFAQPNGNGGDFQLFKSAVTGRRRIGPVPRVNRRRLACTLTAIA